MYFEITCACTCASWGRGKEERERERDNISSRLCTLSAEPDTGLELIVREIMTWAKSKVRCLTRWAIWHPKGLHFSVLYLTIIISFMRCFFFSYSSIRGSLLKNISNNLNLNYVINWIFRDIGRKRKFEYISKINYFIL